jgi:DNA topoisomerase-1
MSELWIIEAPGKAKILQAILVKLGLDAVVQATRGHFMSMPPGLVPIGIDSRLHEHLRAPPDLDLVKRIRDMARESSKVVVATDADVEGDVIAWDVAVLISDIQPDPVRVKLRGFDDDSVKEAISLAGPVRKEDAIAGRTRAIIDRLIGAVYTTENVTVGRVSTAILGVIQRDTPSVWQMNLSAPAKDGGRPWLASCAVKAPLTKALADRLAGVALPAMDARAAPVSLVYKPGNMGDIMVRASDELGLKPTQTAAAMQKSYESGMMSYPRAGSRGVSKVAAKRMRNVLIKAGYKFSEDAVAGKDGDDVHDAPHPIGGINVTLDPKKLGDIEGVRTLIARDLVKTGQRHTRENPITARLQAFLIQLGFPEDVARMVAGLDWHRDQGPRFPGQEAWGVSEVVRRPAEAVLLESVMAAGLGRPSTLANHVDKFLSRGLVDAQMNLTAKGRNWIEASPASLSGRRKGMRTHFGGAFLRSVPRAVGTECRADTSCSPARNPGPATRCL